MYPEEELLEPIMLPSIMEIDEMEVEELITLKLVINQLDDFITRIIRRKIER